MDDKILFIRNTDNTKDLFYNSLIIAVNLCTQKLKKYGYSYYINQKLQSDNIISELTSLQLSICKFKVEKKEQIEISNKCINKEIMHLYRYISSLIQKIEKIN